MNRKARGARGSTVNTTTALSAPTVACPANACPLGRFRSVAGRATRSADRQRQDREKQEARRGEARTGSHAKHQRPSGYRLHSASFPAAVSEWEAEPSRFQTLKRHCRFYARTAQERPGARDPDRGGGGPAGSGQEHADTAVATRRRLASVSSRGRAAPVPSASTTSPLPCRVAVATQLFGSFCSALLRVLFFWLGTGTCFYWRLMTLSAAQNPIHAGEKQVLRAPLQRCCPTNNRGPAKSGSL